MKTICNACLLFLALACAGCFDFTEEIWLNKNRSGRYEMTIEMGSGPFASMLRMAQEKTNDSLRALGQPPRSQDTIIVLANLPDSVKRLFPYPDALNNTRLDFKVDKALRFKFQFDFKKIEDIAQFWETLQAFDRLQKDSTLKGLDAPAIGNLSGMLSGVPDLKFDGKLLQRSTRVDTTSQEIGQLFFENQDDGLAKMMFRNKTYRIIYHLPKKPKSVSGAGFSTDGKTVSGRFPLLDVMRDNQKLSCEIRVK
ncbi:MAG: hypothetical protein IT260_01225 [Saprospiraceae bacterium]|nr:hypothetical protein [Saprospiraceae bacterium]